MLVSASRRVLTAFHSGDEEVEETPSEVELVPSDGSKAEHKLRAESG